MGASFTGMHRALEGYYGLRLLARQSLAAVVKVPASHRGRRGAPMARRDDREPGPPPRVVCAVGWQYRAIFEGGATQPARGPQRGSRVGVERGCIAGRMQPDFYHGLRGRVITFRSRRSFVTMADGCLSAS